MTPFPVTDPAPGNEPYDYEPYDYYAANQRAIAARRAGNSGVAGGFEDPLPGVKEIRLPDPAPTREMVYAALVQRDAARELAARLEGQNAKALEILTSDRPDHMARSLAIMALEGREL